MQLRPILPLALVLGSQLSAQLSFDVIAPDLCNAEANSTFQDHEGLIVNTGTVPIDVQTWQFGSLYTASSEELAWLEVTPSWSPSGTFQLQPGEAAGTNDPLYLSLLEPGETYVDNAAYGAASVRLNGQLGQSPLFTVHFQIGDQRVRFEMQPTFVDGVSEIEPVTAKRWSSETVTPHSETVAQGCYYPGTDVMGLDPFGGGEPFGGTVGRYSDLPFVGNSRFHLQLSQQISDAEAGAPWMLLVAPAGDTLPIYGCHVITNAVPALSGVLLSSPFPGTVVTAPVPAPLPGDPVLAGVKIDLQWLVATPNASNGTFVASDVQRLRLET